MNNFIKQIINEKFESQSQSRMFFKKGKRNAKWRKWGNEFASETDHNESPEKSEEVEQMYISNMIHNGNSEGDIDEIVDNDGNIKTGSKPGNPNAYIRSKKTSDQVAKSTMGQMGSFGVLGGATGANKTLKYWAESDQSHALGNEIKNDSDMDYEDATEYFTDELEVPEDEAKDRVEKMGFDPELPDGKMRLIENPKKYIKEYLAKKIQNNGLVKKASDEKIKTPLNPIIKKQLSSMKQTLKDNGLTMSDITEYLEDNE